MHSLDQTRFCLTLTVAAGVDADGVDGLGWGVARVDALIRVRAGIWEARHTVTDGFVRVYVT